MAYEVCILAEFSSASQNTGVWPPAQPLSPLFLSPSLRSQPSEGAGDVD